MSVLRWGIAGCGTISHDFSLAILRLNSPRHKLVAAASKSSAETADKFAKRFNMPKSYGNYEDLIADPEINAVYVGNLHPGHMPVAMAVIEAGKAVLVEKPMTMSEAETRRLLHASRSKGVLAVEGVWCCFNPMYERLRKLCKAQKPIALMANCTIDIEHVARLAHPELGGGAMWDLGIYGAQLATLVFGGQKPTQIFAAGQLSKLGVDAAESVSLQYACGGNASILVDIRCGDPLLCEARIFFERGSEFSCVKIFGQYWASTKMELTKADGSTVVEEFPIYPDLKDDDGLDFNFINSQALAYEAEGFADAFENWKASSSFVEHPLRSHSDTLIDAHIMDTVIAQVKRKATALS